MSSKKQWGLGTKLVLLGTPFLLMALLLISSTLWVSWQLDGGAAAVNEAGRMRMQAYAMALSVSTADAQALSRQAAEFGDSLKLLRSGDPERPLLVPWDETVQSRFAVIEREWAVFRNHWVLTRPDSVADLGADTMVFTSHIDALVAGIEAHMSRWTTLLHLLQLAMMALAVVSTTLLLYCGYLYVLEPVEQLKKAIERIQGGDFHARVEKVTSDEFGTLAEGFNGMAQHLQTMYRTLESKVAEKTAQLQEKSARLESLYQVNMLVTQADSLDELAKGFAQSIQRIAHADGVALRWSSHANERYLMLAAQGLPAYMLEAEQCIHAGDCHCGTPTHLPGLRIIPIQGEPRTTPLHCAKAGFETVINIPIRLHERVMGEVDLFFHARIALSTGERSLLEALTSHLASAMENLRLDSLEKEAAVSQERHLLARELHDSIAQSLAFLKIQVQLMRDAVRSLDRRQMEQVLDEIDTGVRESYGDVRELLLHFRTRTNTEDIEPALATTLQKFEHQSGLKTTLQMTGYGVSLPPDLQIQVLHIVQEALSNVRKHARASQVWLDVQQQPEWRFEVRDDGIGFDVDGSPFDDTHVGLRIMAERAARIGARLEVLSTRGRGTSMVLTLPPLPSTLPALAPAARFGATTPS
ncbi:MAG: type IV pili methyl-accepting chemotaxis transducer N-terminal domain-containing protein [Rhodoferax sp.]|nr:type IV pili methyl-accepting chemotaxis transducer N-terminal domain-containing protein [Rhodoferax sp.]